MTKTSAGRESGLAMAAAKRLRALALAAGLVSGLSGCGGPEPEVWHEVQLDREFTAERELGSFQEYLALEQALFEELDERVYAGAVAGPEQALQRYSRGSLADPGERRPDWNRSFELVPEHTAGGVLLLHGMSDSPYSLRALGQTLQGRGYRVLGLRLPGHGTAPSGMVSVSWQDMAAATDLAWDHLTQKSGGGPVHVIGYSTGAALALDLALRAEQDASLIAPSSLC